MRGRISAVAASTALLCAATLGSTVVQAASANASPRTVLPGTAAPAAARAHSVGTVGRSSRVNFQLVLRLRDKQGAEALVQALSTPGRASYRHYLTAAQWEARFSPTAAQVEQAKGWLRGQGFAVGAVSKDRLTIAASGTAAQVESAFATRLKNYRVATHTVRMASVNLSVPTSIAGRIVGAIGINQHVATPAAAGVSNPDVPGRNVVARAPGARPGQFPPAPPAFLPAPPCGAYYGVQLTIPSPPFGMGYPATVPDIVCGYKPGHLRSAYGVTSAATGKGVTVAVIDAYGSATIAADAKRYFDTNDPGNPFANAHLSQILATPFDNEMPCDASGWATEQAIDVEAVHAMAPNAKILYYGAQNCLDPGLFAAEQDAIDNRLADVVTNSWDTPGGDLLGDATTRAAYDNLFLLADAIGMTIQFSSGDDGDNFKLVGFSAPSYPASSPLATAVGGTTLKIGATGERIGELGWNIGRSFLCTANLVSAVTGCTSSTLNTWLPAAAAGASGGYTSYSYTQPFYQAPVVPIALSERNAPALGRPVPMRVVPDISLEGDPGTGFLVGLQMTLPNGGVQYTETRYGGTSLSSPLLAGVVADADQAAAVPVGFINPAIYRLGARQSSAVDDILPAPSPEGNFRVDYAGPLGLGLPATGFATSFRELNYTGLQKYCDPTGNCATRPETLSAAKGYDSLTGLGSPGTNFIAALAGL